MAMLLLAVLPHQEAAASWWPWSNKGIRYTITIEGLDKEMQAWIHELELDKPVTTNPPKDKDALEQESNALALRIKKALDAKGYLESQVDAYVDKNAKKPVIQILAFQEIRYHISAITFDWDGEPLLSLKQDSLQSKTGAPVDMGIIQQDAEMLLKDLGTNSCLLSLSVAPKLRLYSKTRQAEIVFAIQHGPRADMGNAIITGTEQVKDEVVQRSIGWKKGECFDAAKLEKTRTSLMQSQLFSTVDITPSDTVDAQGQVAVTIAVKERVPRTISAGVEYSTDQGMGVSSGWEHRNFWGGAEKVNADALIAERKQSLSGTLRLPEFMREKQSLVLSSAIKHEDADAYQATSLDGSATLERKLANKLTGGLGVGYTLSHTEDEVTGANDYALLSFPGFLEYDSRDNPLDARHGVYGRLAVTPYTETIGDGGQFVKIRATGYHYLSNDALALKPTLAMRASVGSITGGTGDDIPADIRFYAGGGGSVRGYSYESLSPRQGDVEIGGSSLLEGSAEMRLRFSPTVGGVVFLDAGNAYDNATPDIGEKLYYGAGIGGRYYSPIGPLRADMAFPLNGSDIGQTGYALYISLGQAF